MSNSTAARAVPTVAASSRIAGSRSRRMGRMRNLMMTSCRVRIVRNPGRPSAGLQSDMELRHLFQPLGQMAEFNRELRRVARIDRPDDGAGGPRPPPPANLDVH